MMGGCARDGTSSPELPPSTSELLLGWRSFPARHPTENSGSGPSLPLSRSGFSSSCCWAVVGGGRLSDSSCWDQAGSRPLSRSGCPSATPRRSTSCGQAWGVHLAWRSPRARRRRGCGRCVHMNLPDSSRTLVAGKFPRTEQAPVCVAPSDDASFVSPRSALLVPDPPDNRDAVPRESRKCRSHAQRFPFLFPTCPHLPAR